MLQIGPDVLGYGSGGTVVFDGELDGRPVAVKRMLRQFVDMARKEIDALILADEHPNIVRQISGTRRDDARLCREASIVCVCVEFGASRDFAVLAMQMLCFGRRPRVCVPGIGEVQDHVERGTPGLHCVVGALPALTLRCPPLPHLLTGTVHLKLTAVQVESMCRAFLGPDGKPTAFAYQVAADIGFGVAALHERGLVPRDLKPHNVLLTEGGR